MGCVGSRARDDDGGGTHAYDFQWDGRVRDVGDWKLELALTPEHLQRLRAEFWETRVEGKPEMWQALRAAAEALDVRRSILLTPASTFSHTLSVRPVVGNSSTHGS